MSTPEQDQALCPADAAAVDALLEHGGGWRMTGSVEPARVERVGAWLETIAAQRAAQPPQDLAARTLAAVQAEANSPKADGGEENPTHGLGLRRLAEYATVGLAASVLVAVVLPGLATARNSAKRVACANNLGTIGHGLDAYAVSYNGALPSLAAPADQNWMLRDPEAATPTNHSNAANLLPLVRGEQRHVRGVENFACPAQAANVSLAGWSAESNEIPEALLGYSYANLMGASPPRWDRQRGTIVLADRNPLFTGRGCATASVNSANHGGNGMYVLRADGAVTWETSPNVGPGGDNIWTVAYKTDPAQQQYRGTETPRSVRDVFLSP